MWKPFRSRLPALRWPRLQRPRKIKVEAQALKNVSTKAPGPIKTLLEDPARMRTTPVAPALLLATGAGVAFWWWTQWARGAAENEPALEEKTLKPDA